MKRSGYLAWTYITLAGLSGLTQVFPGLVSKPLRDYVEEKGMPVGMTDAFKSPDVRVYSRTSPLQPFHLTGLLVRSGWSDALEGRGSYFTAAAQTVLSPLHTVFRSVSQGMSSFIPEDAWSVRVGDRAADGPVFMRAPTGELEMRDIISRTVRARVKAMHFKSDTAEMVRLFNQHVILHEGRHTEQPVTIGKEKGESEADIFAWAFLKASTKNSAALQELQTLSLNMRIVSAMTNKGGHATSMAIEDNDMNMADKGSAAFKKLAEMSMDVTKKHKASFPDDMNHIERRYYAVSQMLKAGKFENDKLLKRAALSYIDACTYFSTTCVVIRTDRMPQSLKAPARIAGVQNNGAAL